MPGKGKGEGVDAVRGRCEEIEGCAEEEEEEEDFLSSRTKVCAAASRTSSTPARLRCRLVLGEGMPKVKRSASTGVPMPFSRE